jgi:hypothetical protein
MLHWLNDRHDWEFSEDGYVRFYVEHSNDVICGLEPGVANVQDTTRAILTGILSAPPEVLEKFRGHP